MDIKVIDSELKKFNVTDAAIAEMKEKYLVISVNGIEDKAGYLSAKTGRAEVKAVRVDVEKKRKELKEDSLKFGRAVDTEARRITNELESIEKHLDSMVKAVEDEKARIAEEARKDKQAKLQQRLDAFNELNYRVEISVLEMMSDCQFDITLTKAKERFAEERAKAEEERAKVEAARREEDMKALELERARIEEQQKAWQLEKEEAEKAMAEKERLLLIEKEKIALAEKSLPTAKIPEKIGDDTLYEVGDPFNKGEGWPLGLVCPNCKYKGE